MYRQVVQWNRIENLEIHSSAYDNLVYDNPYHIKLDRFFK